MKHYYKVSGGDRIQVELFQILKDDAVKVLQSICQQIWKTQQQPQDMNSLALSVLYGPALKSIHDYWKNNSFDYIDLEAK